MSSNTRLVLIGLSLIVVMATVGSVVMNWDAVVEALDAQARRTELTLFRWGEMYSIGGEVEREYGIQPDMAYETDERGRVLSMVFRDHELPADTTAEGHARELAVFATGKTKKYEQIDVIDVRFRSSIEPGSTEADGASAAYSFTLEELMATPSSVQVSGSAEAEL